VRSERTAAEWVTLAVCSAILVVVVGLIVWQIPNDDDRPAPVASTGPVERVGDDFHVTVLVSNSGGRTASNVQVTATLVVDGVSTQGDQTIDFLAPNDTERMAFVFADDPASGDLDVRVSGYAIP